MRHRKEDSEPPFVLLINKQDLSPSREATTRDSEGLVGHSKSFRTSAKTGERVNEAFEHLVRQMLDADRPQNS